MGTSGLTAQSYGSKDSISQSQTLHRGLVVAMFSSFFLLAISPLIYGPILQIMNGEETETLRLARQYFIVAIWGCPAVLASFVLSGWFLGMQNSRIPMYMALCTNLVNIVVSVSLVYACGLKIEGVAIGTASAQWAGAILGFVFIKLKYKPLQTPIRSLLNTGALRAYFKLHFDIFLRTLCLIAVTLWFTHSGAASGVFILAANALLLQLFFLFSYFMDGFAYAGEALGGKYAGASDNAGVISLTQELIKTGIFFALLFSTIYAFGGELIFKLLSDNEQVRTVASSYLWWAVALPICGFMAFVLDGIMIGLMKTRGMLIALLGGAIIFFVFYFISQFFHMGNHGLWLAFDLYLAARGFIQLWEIKKGNSFNS